MLYPKISIVTPNYNCSEFLEETLKSVIDQKYPNLEYIVIDGGSTDDSINIIKKYEKHLTYWISEPDKGHGNALNKGFAKTTGEIMAWINSDDIYYPYTFKTVAEIFNKFKDINWIQGKNSRIDKLGRLEDVHFSFINIFSYLLNDYKWIQQESVFWRRNLWDEAGGYIDEKIKLMVDGELWTRFFLFDDIWHLDLVIGGFRRHNHNRSNLNIECVNEEMIEVINKMKSLLSPELLSSFNELLEFLDVVQKSKEIEQLRSKWKILKLLPHFLYTRILNYVISEKKDQLYIKNNIHNLKYDSYNYKLINSMNNNWTKGIRKFKSFDLF